MPYTDFHYTPTGTGVISGKEVLEQTEDAINDLGGQISGDVQTAIDTANNALNTANTASADAQNAVNTANTAYTTATNAQNTANAAQTTATNALTAAQNAQNDVNALGNRVTTAENNITQNTTNISGLTTRMGTAEGNITTLQNDVVTAQGTATSAQNTATMARQQAYVLRYSSTAITDNSTIAYSTLDNTDNIKADDKIIDVDGKIFSIVSVDSDNSTVTVGSALIDLALDANVVHTSGNETVGGAKTFSDNLTIYNSDTSGTTPKLSIKSALFVKGDTTNTDSLNFQFLDKFGNFVSSITTVKNISGSQYLQFSIRTTDADNNNISSTINYYLAKSGERGFIPYEDGLINLGTTQRRWKDTCTYFINGLTPSSLGMPDLNNTLDISGYITDLTGSPNVYSPPANGYIVLRSTTANVLGIVENTTGMGTYSQGSNQVLAVNLPVVKNSSISIYAICSSLTHAKFIPCQGNI